MALYYVCGQDNIFGGLHGMKYDTIVEGGEEDALEVGRELAADVIGSYECIIELLEDDVAELCEKYGIDSRDYFSWTSEQEEKIDEIRNDVYEEDMDYYYIPLAFDKLPCLDPYELEHILCTEGSEAFLEKYAAEE